MTADEKMVRDMYIDLLATVLTNQIYKDPALKRSFFSKVVKAFGGSSPHEAQGPFDEEKRRKGLDWPSQAHTMIGIERLANLRMAVSQTVENGVPGDLVETGVWRGGACIFMRGILKAYGIENKRVFVCDSFAGLPKPDGAYEADKGDKHHTQEVLAVGVEDVKNNFRAYGLLDDQVEFLVGWFKDTLPSAPIEQVSVLRLDGDMYESTMDGLKALYHKVSPGGYVIVDDYHAVGACKKAVHDFLESDFPTETVCIQEIDGTGVYWVRQPV